MTDEELKLICFDYAILVTSEDKGSDCACSAIGTTGSEIIQEADKIYTWVVKNRIPIMQKLEN